MSRQYPVFFVNQDRIGETKALNRIGVLLYLDARMRSGIAGKGLKLDDWAVGNFSFGGCGDGHGVPFVIKSPL